MELGLEDNKNREQKEKAEKLFHKGLLELSSSCTWLGWKWGVSGGSATLAAAL